MIAVIIPALNEADQLPATLAALANNASQESHEVVVVDGGSRDGTVEVARAAGARIVVAPKSQRAAQMNLGVRNTRGDVLLFLHADTHLPPAGLTAIETAMRQAPIVGGGFARRFASPSRFLRLTARFADWRGRTLGWFLGDQAIFSRRDTFERLGGYLELDLFEDLDFSRRLAKSGRVVTLFPPVLSSARRFAARGPLVTTVADVWLTCRFLAGRSVFHWRGPVGPRTIATVDHRKTST